MSETRAQKLSRIANEADFDVVVIGGGVNGIGVFRDLSLQGLRVLLVERSDFCSGCSSAPSRMIHGGLRYLENGEFDLVRESLRERDAMLANAPHMVRPLPTIIPITSIFSGVFNAAASFFGGNGKPSNRGLVPIMMGLSLYDWVTRKHRVLPVHRLHGKKNTRARWPQLTRAARFSATYYDAWISHPERLCVELIRDTEADGSDCIAMNYAQLLPKGDGFELVDAATGERLAVSPKVIVNATGAWLDGVARQIGGAADENMVSGTKGSHLVIDNPDLLSALDDHMVYFENSDGRVCIVFPYLGKVLAGSTDIRVDAASRVRCEPEEQQYIITSLGLVFPDIPVTSEQVEFSFSGIRPLPRNSHDFTGRISRGHYIRRLEGRVPQFCMIGGKWTTFRAFAEQTADTVLKALNRERSTSTLAMPIGGGNGFTDAKDHVRELEQTYNINAERAAHLVDHYGTRAAEIIGFCQQREDDRPLVAGSQYTEAEIAYLVRNEYVQSLSDLVLRRTSLAICGQISADLIDRLSTIVGCELGLSRQDAAVLGKTLVSDLADFHGVSANQLETRNNTRSIECA